jgi:hypothetical protein
MKKLFELFYLSLYKGVGFALLVGQLIGCQSNNTVDSQEKTVEQLAQEEYNKKRLRRLNGYHKSNSPDEYRLYDQLIRTGEGANAPTYQYGYLMKAYQEALKNAVYAEARTESTITWRERGPANVPARTRAILIDPDNSQIWLAGSASGGIWRSTDRGRTWTNLTPNLPSLSTNALARSNANPNVIYAGTGEGYGNTGAVVGVGIFKSTDRGTTWQALSSTTNDANFKYVNRIIVDPRNENTVLAATDTGIFRSTNGGTTWTQVYVASSDCQQILFTPTNFSIQYAAINGGTVVKSTDAGLTWLPASEGIIAGKRIELAIAPQNPNKLYASLEIDSNQSEVFVTENGGSSWQQINENPTINFMGGQGWYDNCVLVSPLSENSVFVGGVNIWRIDVGTETTQGTTPTLLGVSELNTQSFLSFVRVQNFTEWNSRIQTGTGMTTIEIRFGANRKQKAHRFTVPPGATSGVPANQYTYRDYVDVPFEVWDVARNQQLMVSFRDQKNDGQFELEEQSTDPIPREYLYIHTIPYSSTTPSPEITVDGGHVIKMMYNLWPVLTAGAKWDAANLPTSTLRIAYGFPTLRQAKVDNITDAYSEFDKENGFASTHPDHHILLALPSANANTFTLLSGNDGGFSISEDGGRSFNRLGRNYNTTQFYGADKATGVDIFAGGTQDNGTWLSPQGSVNASTDYRRIIGGDGFEVVFNAKNPNQIFGSSQFNGFNLSRNGGTTWSSGTSGMTDTGSSNAPFISRVGYSPASPDVLMVVGRSGVWRSTDFGTTWQLTRITDARWLFRLNTPTDEPSMRPMNVRISSANPNIVWAGGGMTSQTSLFVSTDGGRNFTATTNITRPMGAMTNIIPHPTEPNTAFVTFSLPNRPKVLLTRDLGKTWTDLSGFGATGTNTVSSNGFPDIAVYTVFVFPKDTQRIWAGTELGIFETTNGGQSWNYLQSDLPSVAIWSMKLVDNQVVIATHGRGIWTAELPKEELPTGFFDDLITQNLRMYPNPVQDKAIIELPLQAQTYTISVYNLLGQKALEKTITAANQTSLELATLPQGVYVLEAVNGKQRYTAKFIKE